MLRGGEEVGELLQRHIGKTFRPSSQLSLQQWHTSSDTRSMIIAIAIAVAALGAFGGAALKFGPEDRPGFDERRPLA